MLFLYVELLCNVLNNWIITVYSLSPTHSFLLKMPPKKVTAVSGNGGMKKKKISSKRKERDFSSDDEFDYEQENNKKPGKPCAKSALQPVTVAEDIKEKIVGLIELL